jgi:hypothetical protein
MKRNILISGDFSLTELQNNEQTAPVIIKSKKASERIEALKQAGVDTSNLFAIGDSTVIRIVNGVPSQVFDNDPVYEQILKNGTIPDRRLFRRWVMAQMFYILRRMETKKMSFVSVIQCYGYEYQWRMLEEEMRVQTVLYRKDAENFFERNLFFNSKVVLGMMLDYEAKLISHVCSLKIKHCKGLPYKTVCGNHYFISDIENKLYKPLRDIYDNLPSDSDKLYQAVRKFNKLRPHLKWQTKQAPAFIDAYKGAGAFFTMKNLILFHGCLFSGIHTKGASMNHLQEMAQKAEGWELLGAMKQLIADNNISVTGKINEWRKRK